MGYRNGDNLAIEYRWADENLSLLERQANELVRLPVDVIGTAPRCPLCIAKKATSTIRIVMAAAVDPVAVRATCRKHFPRWHGRSQALLVKNNSLTYELRAPIIETTKRLHIPDMYEERELVAAGGLVSYGPSAAELYRQAAGYVDRVFKGSQPADLPVQQPTKFELALNLKTAKAIDVTIPQSPLLRADELIQ